MKSLLASLWLGGHLLARLSAAEQPLPEPTISQSRWATSWIAQYYFAAKSGLSNSVVHTFTLAVGPCQERAGDWFWLHLNATTASGGRFGVWLLSDGYPSPIRAEARAHTARYILQESDAEPVEFRDRFTGEPVLPASGAWKYLFPQAAIQNELGQRASLFPHDANYLGHRYYRETLGESVALAPPTHTRIVDLLPDVLVGLPNNTRQKDATRRYDGSDYELVRLTREDYREMAEAGINCVRVDAEQLPWVENLKVFYWGVGGNAVPYPECLYRSCYLGPELFLDEPAVVTRDYVIRPKLAKDEILRKTLTPQLMFEAFQEHFRKASTEGAPAALPRSLRSRADVSLGDMQIVPEHIFSWETMVSSAAYQLSQDPLVPEAMVFEPPGRIGTFRTLPEMDMTYGCQLAVDDPKHLTDIIYGFLRGAARLTNKTWGTSIYGAVDQADAYWFLTHAYDLGATRFFFWDTAGLACVPFPECLSLARNLQTHARNYPRRDLAKLKRAAETAILLPPGYNLGHVQMGKGSLWGLGELNLERTNRAGVTYRTVMANFFAEIENYFRQGTAFDLLWDLPGLKLPGYREVIRIQEDGKVEISQAGESVIMDHARIPARPAGSPPQLAVKLSAWEGKAPLSITATASVEEKSAPVYYTVGADPKGVYYNAMVAWELYGPGEADYRALSPPGMRPMVNKKGAIYEVIFNFRIERPGHYRLRAATVDLAGRSTVKWTPILATE